MSANVRTIFESEHSEMLNPSFRSMLAKTLIEITLTIGRELQYTTGRSHLLDFLCAT